MLNFIGYLLYMLKHKYWIWRASHIWSLPWWLVLTHDVSKFYPSELIPRSQYFFNGLRFNHADPIGTPEISVATQLHYRRNKHHWQHWLMDGSPTEIPKLYCREMVADWWAAGQAQGQKSNGSSWYAANRNKILLHPKTRIYIERLITMDIHAEVLP